MAGPAMVDVKCEWCAQEFTARVADRKRGWAKFCSKQCKAHSQEAEKADKLAALKADPPKEIKKRAPRKSKVLDADHKPDCYGWWA